MPDPPYVDDPTIKDDADLWRRIHLQQLVTDDNSGGVRPSSQAFNDSSDGTPMSVLIAEAMIADNRGPDDAIVGHEGFFLASITAGDARALGQGVARKSSLDEDPAHGSVFGKKTVGVRKALAKRARWIIEPIGPR